MRHGRQRGGVKQGWQTKTQVLAHRHGMLVGEGRKGTTPRGRADGAGGWGGCRGHLEYTRRGGPAPRQLLGETGVAPTVGTAAGASEGATSAGCHDGETIGEVVEEAAGSSEAPGAARGSAGEAAGMPWAPGATRGSVVEAPGSAPGTLGAPGVPGTLGGASARQVPHQAA